MTLIRAKSTHTGHVVEIGRQTLEAFPDDYTEVDLATPTLVEEQREAELVEAAAGAFDPADHNMAEVLDYLNASSIDEAERARVLDAERSGKARAGVLGDA